jgi:hypothetical protein
MCFWVAGSTFAQSMSSEGVSGPASYYQQRPIVVVYAASSTSTASSAATAAPGSSVTPLISSPTISSIATTAPSGLSTGAKAGIGVGASMGTLAVIAGLVFLWILSRRRKRANAKTQREEYGKPELHGEAVERSKIINEADADLSGMWRLDGHRPELPLVGRACTGGTFLASRI